MFDFTGSFGWGDWGGTIYVPVQPQYPPTTQYPTTTQYPVTAQPPPNYMMWILFGLVVYVALKK